MKVFLVFITLGFYCSLLISQESIAINTIEAGIKFTGNVLFISDENKRLLTDETYRDQIYPHTYTFQSLSVLIEKGNMSLALWHMINLYQTNPVFTILIVNDISVLDVQGEHFVEAFHTYAYTDPRVSKIENGSYELMTPEALDKHIAATNALAYFLARVQAGEN